MRSSLAAIVAAAVASLTLVACAPNAPPPIEDDDVAAEGEGEPAIDNARVRDIAASFDVAMKQCPERVWPGHSWDDNAVVLTLLSEERAWVWTFDGVTEVELASLPVDLRDFFVFSTGTLDGERALGIDLDGTADLGIELYTDFATHLAIHEGFHFLGGQDDFSAEETDGRDPVLPLAFEPRFVRERERDALARAIGDGAIDEAALADARYWSDRHTNDFAADAASLRGLDVFEGTAQYVETIGVIVAKKGCDVSDDEIRAEVSANLELFAPDVGYDAGGESYAIGPLAGVLLRARDGQGFEEAAKSTPLQELLLESVTAANVDESAPVNADARAAAESAIAGVNEAANASIAPIVTAWDDVTNVRLALPTDAMIGSFGYEGGYVLGERADELHVLINAFAQFSPNTGDATLDNVTLVDDFGACGGEVFAVAIDPALATRAGDIVAFSADGVDVSGVTIDEVVDGGATWWCVR